MKKVKRHVKTISFVQLFKMFSTERKAVDWFE